jgi:hypothetical protein
MLWRSERTPRVSGGLVEWCYERDKPFAAIGLRHQGEIAAGTKRKVVTLPSASINGERDLEVRVLAFWSVGFIV